MFSEIVHTATQIVEGFGGLVGIRTSEEPLYVHEAGIGDVEIRRYGPRIAAQTVVTGDQNAARNAGFRRIAGYIFGGNHRKTTISMTAPVAQQSEKIAMTAPVAQSRGTEGGSVIRFFMPSQWSMDLLPEPDDERVELVEVPGETYAVLRFSGDRSPATVAAKTDELLKAVQHSNFETVGEPVAWFYDPPWTLPFRRRNEVAVAVTSSG
jgi:hypothetical protein